MKSVAGALGVAAIGGACEAEIGSGPLHGGNPAAAPTARAFPGVETRLVPGSVAEQTLIFPDATLAGSMTGDSVVLTTRIADPRPKRLLVWQTTSREGIVRVVADHTVDVGPGGYSKANVVGLEPGAHYQYAFFNDRNGNLLSRSGIGSFRSTLSPDARDPVTVAISACNGGFFNPLDRNPFATPFSYPALEATARHDYDLFIHLGDQAYMDLVYVAGGSYEQYLHAWRAYLGSEGMRRAYARAGMYCTIDDHEVADNLVMDLWTMTTADMHRIGNGRHAYSTVMPFPEAAPDVALWRSFRWGKTAEFIMLDCRYERGKLNSGQYLSPAQMAFLKQRLRDSPCHFKVVANSVPITDMPGRFDLGPVRNDRWEGYQRDREQVLQHINQERIENVFFLSGDLHVNFVSRLNPRGDDLASRTREIAVTGGHRGEFELPTNAQFQYGCRDPRGCLLTFDPARNRVRVRYLRPQDGSIEFDAEIAGATTAA